MSVSIQQFTEAFSRTASRTDRRAVSAGPVDLVVVETIEQSVSKLRAILLGMVMTGLPVIGGRLLSMEKGLHARVAAECLDPFVASIVQAAHNDEQVLREAEAIIGATPGLRPQRCGEEVSVTFLGGTKATIESPYYLCRAVNHRKAARKTGRRAAQGNGEYPVLAALGIDHRVTPALASEVARLLATSTEAEAHQSLVSRGIHLDPKTVATLAGHLARRALRLRALKMRKTQNGYRGRGQVRGKRIVIGTDGGRIRTRVPIKNGRRRRSGRRGFDAPWREPKILIVYEIDDKGKKVKKGHLRYDGTMGDADALFAILVSLLREIGAAEAAEWVIVADGAIWIWDRIPNLIDQLGYDPAKVTEVVDFYHATERLTDIADLRTGWTQSQRTEWINRAKGHLYRGDIDRVLADAHELCKGRKAKKVRDLLGYFDRHRNRMRYDILRKRCLPMGSGAVESCVRRTINLRMKSNGIFWLIENAEGLLHMRAQLLCGRWNDHMLEVLTPEALWDRSFLC